MKQPNLPGFDVEMARIDAQESQKSIDEETRQKWLASKFAYFKRCKNKQQQDINHYRAMKCIYFMSHKTY